MQHSEVTVDHCLGFRWDKINFLQSGWYDAVFWIQEKKNVDKTSTFLLLQSSAAQRLGLFSFSFSLPSGKAGGTQGTGKGQNQDSTCGCSNNAGN